MLFTFVSQTTYIGSGRYSKVCRCLGGVYLKQYSRVQYYAVRLYDLLRHPHTRTHPHSSAHRYTMMWSSLG